MASDSGLKGWSDVSQLLLGLSSDVLHYITFDHLKTAASRAIISLPEGVAVEDDGLEGLDDVLNRNVFTQLREVSFHLWMAGKDKSISDMTLFVERRLPKLHNRHLISCRPLGPIYGQSC